MEEDYRNSIKILEKKQIKNIKSIIGISDLAFPVYYEGFKGEAIGCSTKTQSKLRVVCIGYEEIHSDRSNIFYSIT